MWIDDQVFRQCGDQTCLESWIPESSLVVLGAANKAARECRIEACERDGVPIVKRAGGGGTVLLHPGVVVLSYGAWVRDRFENSRYFSLLNSALIESLAQMWTLTSDLTQRGISDICLGSKKVAGTSLFRSRNYLLYQVSVLVDARKDEIEKYLDHPSREPEYRKGKPHADFVAGLAEFIPGLLPEQVRNQILSSFDTVACRLLEKELVQPVSNQVQHILKRASENRGTEPCLEPIQIP